MQVSCGQCGMRYEFDAAEIPAEGYDAQCSNCDSVFFVAPEAPVAQGSHDLGVTQDDAHIVPQVSMQVAIGCPQCGAVYQFDSLDVPETGYDAQCTQCESIFLVAPHTVAPYEAPHVPPAPAGADDETSFASVNELLGQADSAPNAQASPNADSDDHVYGAEPERTRVTTPAEHAYSEAASLEPTRPGFSPQLLDGGTFERTDPQLQVPEGYAGHVPARADAPARGPDMQAGAPVSPPPLGQKADAAANAGLPSGASAAQAAPAPPDVPAEHAEPTTVGSAPALSAWTTEAERVESLNMPPTNPVMMVPSAAALAEAQAAANAAASPLRAAPTDDAAAARRARRSSSQDTGAPPGRALRIVLVLLAVLLGGLWIVSQKRPELIAQVLQSKSQPHAVDGEALALFEQGKKALLRDTDPDYEAAIDTFGKALQHDGQYMEAQAWQIVAHSLRGADLRREGARLYADWEQEQAQWRGLKALERQGTTLSPEQVVQSQQLEEQGPKHLQAATDTLERGGKELSVGQVQAQRARTISPRSASVVAATALYYTQTPSDMNVAQSLLGQYNALIAPDADVAPSKPVSAPADVWLLLAQGRAAAAQEKTRDEGRAAFTQALQVEPNLVRARWELALLDEEAGQVADAKKRYQEILAAVPNHPKSMAALERLNAAAAAAASPTPAAPAADLDAIAPAAGSDGPGAEPAPVPKRPRHRRRVVAPGEPSAAPAAPPPIPADE